MKAFETVVDLSPVDAEAAVRAALAEQGFGATWWSRLSMAAPG